MADYYTQFSATFGPLKKEEKEWLEEQLTCPAEEEVDSWPDEKIEARMKKYELDDKMDIVNWPLCDWSFDTIHDETHIWFRSEEGGQPDKISLVMKWFLKKFRPYEFFKVESSYSCSKMRTDGFGGAAFFVTADKVKCMSTIGWLEDEVISFKQNEYVW